LCLTRNPGHSFVSLIRMCRDFFPTVWRFDSAFQQGNFSAPCSPCPSFFTMGCPACRVCFYVWLFSLSRLFLSPFWVLFEFFLSTFFNICLFMVGCSACHMPFHGRVFSLSQHLCEHPEQAEKFACISDPPDPHYHQAADRQTIHRQKNFWPSRPSLFFLIIFIFPFTYCFVLLCPSSLGTFFQKKRNVTKCILWPMAHDIPAGTRIGAPKNSGPTNSGPVQERFWPKWHNFCLDQCHLSLIWRSRRNFGQKLKIWKVRIQKPPN